ncbi:MAG: SUMF1/EgtB/PvdO family nonheme iron enzyme [Planctomycetes bacterium]|nr:SUMF1/EgtB/PvdO family nonheme iron enzyme [Planctomycetota bacterium]MCB9890400.1 SUMF1/EgtB/PvdO family nonheme iron enzyme [Planctomycetota bacterium]MCB9917641.1 SUMF1/EgtB/PvdO family nonheme iron enzyme [Planctomycetota bacterium]
METQRTASERGETSAPVLENYRVHHVAGEGAFGAVYVAEQLEPVRRTVAVKVLKAGMDSRAVLARFEVERHVLAMMQHPNIAQIFDAGTTALGRPYFVMERIEGVPLTEYCDARRLSNRERLRIFVQVCSAVNHAHGKGILHRDLKPQNILVTEVDGEAVPKIIDFGIAKSIQGDAPAFAVHTVAGHVLGTPGYMSPEQACSNEDAIDARSDIYSLGVVLYELLTGSLPFDLEEVRKLGCVEGLEWLQERDPPRMTTRVTTSDTEHVCAMRSQTPPVLLRELSGDLEWIVRRAMERDVTRRYETANGFAMDVERFLNNEPVVARPPSASYLTRKFLWRNRIAVAAIATVALALLAGLAVALSQWSVAVDKEALAVEALTNERTALALEQAAVAEYARMRDIPLAEDLVHEADIDLWPANSDKVEAMDLWLERARDLEARAAGHRAALADYRNHARELEPDEERFLIGVVAKLVDRLDRLTGSDGLIEEVAERRGRAATFDTRWSHLTEDAWVSARRRVASNEKYRELSVLHPQRGLVPLGPDPDSGLEEFALLDSGLIPTRNETGRLTLTDEFALVFVLLPPARFWMGAQSTDPSGPNYDATAKDLEGPPHEVTLDAFFISKYEMTQGQWLRVMRTNPSSYHVGRDVNGRIVTARHPVESVDWYACERAMHRIGCLLPTEAQWEYAARAGTATPWWTGSAVTSIVGASNVADGETVAKLFRRQRFEPGISDGHLIHAPCGSFRANPFGLHDTIGNVWEWCRDRNGSYDYRAAPVDGERSSEHELWRAYRGGSFTFAADVARSSARTGYRPVKAGLGLGLRPARRVRSDSR